MSDHGPPAGGAGADARSPTDFSPRAWWEIAKRVYQRWGREQYATLAVGLTFRMIMTLFPVLVAALALFGLVLDPAAVASSLGEALDPLPPAARELVVENAERLAGSPDLGLGIGLTGATLIALWSIHNGALSLLATYNQIYGEEEERGFFKTRLLALGVGLLVLIGISCALVLVVALPDLFDFFQLDGFAGNLVIVGRYLVLATLLVGIQVLLSRWGVDRRSARWPWLQTGTLIGCGLWLLACLCFAWYLRGASRLDQVYGALAGLVVLMLWIQLSAMSLVLGALINCEAEHQTDVDSTIGEDRPQGDREAYAADDSVRGGTGRATG